MTKKRRKLKGTVERVFPAGPDEAEKAQVGIHEAEPLYREIRIENVLTDDEGEKRKLKPGAEVDVIVEADSDATTDVKKSHSS